MAHNEIRAVQKEYTRFVASQRFEHIVVVLTFIGLALTGLPQKFSGEAWAQTMLDWMGGIESVRIVHRIFATVLMAEAIYHGGVLSFKLFVMRARVNMIPTIGDAMNVLQWVGYNLGFVKNHPKMPRYNFGEKVEYLAMVWGTLVMILTGFMLWNPIATSTVLPGESIPTAKLAHGSEALLAVLSVLIWHMYNVHVRHFNKSMFTGKMSREMMLEEHGEELDKIEKGYEDEPPAPEGVARRKRIFWPYAVVMSIILVLGLIRFVTLEQSAITTVPRLAENVNIGIGALGGDPVKGQEVWGSLGVTLECQKCHGEDGKSVATTMNVILAGTRISFKAFVGTVRRGPADMPAFSADQISDEQLQHLYAYLRSLKRT